MKSNSHNGFSDENLVFFPSSKNFQIDYANYQGTFDLNDPLEELIYEFSHINEEDLPDYNDDRFVDASENNEGLDTFYSLDAFMNRHQIGEGQHPDDKLIRMINEHIDAIKEAKERIKFYLDEIDMFMPNRKK